MILWSMMNDLMMHEMLWFSFWNYMICLHGCVNAWVKFALFSFFHFFINLRNVGGVMHMHKLWIIDVWHAMIFFLNLDDNAFMDAWMRECMGEFCFIKKDELLMYAWLGMMYEFFFCIFLKTIFELIRISLLFLIHGVILLWFFFLLF